MCGGVEDRVWSYLSEKPAELRPSAHVHDHGDDLSRAARGRQRLERLEDRVLATAEKDQPARLERHHLSRELAADRAARAGDKHTRVPERVGYRTQVDARRGSTEKILQLHLADRIHRHAAGNDLRKARDGEAANS